ncbi:hypothetical protein MPSEU_000237700 [Mayamaea pseudoterrestris]|nr:hypothetical protein MPSEU_000237700 [Mayamaea pseudoterrestris]
MTYIISCQVRYLVLLLILSQKCCSQKRSIVDAFVVPTINRRRSKLSHIFQAKAASRPKQRNKKKRLSLDDVKAFVETPKDSQFLVLLKQARASIDAGEGLAQAMYGMLLASSKTTNELDQVLTLIQQQEDPQRVKGAFQTCLEWCYEAANAAGATTIHSAMLKAKVEQDAHDNSLVVKSICRANSIDRGIWRNATDFIRLNGDLELQAYDAYLACIAYDGLWKESVRVLRQMQDGQTKPALSTYTIVIESCLYCNQPEQAGQLLVACVRQGVTPTIHLFEQVIAGLSRRLQWRKAMQLVDMMDEMKLPKTLPLHNSMLVAMAKSSESIQAKSLLQRMKREGLRPTTLSYNSVISACANVRYWKDALLVFDQCLREPGVSPDIYTFTNAIRACAKGGKADRALSLLQVAEDTKLPVDAYCYTAAIEACAKVKMWKKALELLETMERLGIIPTEVTYSVTISACGNGGNWEKALDLLNLMSEKKMKIRIITYNAAIAALAKGAKLGKSGYESKELWKISLQLLQRMRVDGIEPDGFSFTSAISCCGAYGKWKEALELFEAMQAGGIRTQPNKIAYTAVISTCAKAGKYEHAIRLFHEMKDAGIPPDNIAYNALFTALRVAGQGKLAFDFWNEMIGSNSAAKTISKLEPIPDFITVQEVIGAITRVGAFESADIVFAEAVRRGIIFDANCFDTSWEIDLTKMTLSLARAACRFILQRTARMSRSGADIEDLIFITGVGRNHDENHPSLREFVQELLSSEFDPPILCNVPRLASGTVVVEKEMILDWSQKQLCDQMTQIATFDR